MMCPDILQVLGRDPHEPDLTLLSLLDIHSTMNRTATVGRKDNIPLTKVLRRTCGGKEIWLQAGKLLND